MSTIAKVAIGVGSAAALGAGVYFGGKKAGWWEITPDQIKQDLDINICLQKYNGEQIVL